LLRFINSLVYVCVRTCSLYTPALSLLLLYRNIFPLHFPPIQSILQSSQARWSGCSYRDTHDHLISTTYAPQARRSTHSLFHCHSVVPVQIRRRASNSLSVLALGNYPQRTTPGPRPPYTLSWDTQTCIRRRFRLGTTSTRCRRRLLAT
jgi:hypothetical protein